MDVANLHRRARQVSTIFNVLANVVAVLGVIAVVVIFVTILTGDTDLGQGLAIIIGAGIYTILMWAGIQMSSLVAGYVTVRTGGADQ